MKIVIYSLMAVATALIIYNFTFIDPDNLLEGESATAVVGILSSSIVLILMIILLMSRAIARKVEE